MASLGDYGIFKVHYDLEEKHIEEVKTYHFNSSGWTTTEVKISRKEVIEKIDNEKKNFITITKKSDGTWKDGAKVITVTINGEQYIKTISNNIEKDNLGELEKY